MLKHTTMNDIVWIKAAKITAIDYFRNTSLTGFKLLFFLDKSKLLQLIWIPFLLTGLIAAVYITGHYLMFFLLNPTVTFINPLQQPVGEVPFPAVSICSVNKISKQTMRRYVNFIYRNKWGPGLNEETLLKKFELFGGFYDTTGFDIDEAYELQTFLDKLDPSNSGFYNVSRVLAGLAPKCEHLLRKCSWEGKTYPCADLFITLSTPEGFCCVFNYNRTGKQKRKIFVKHLHSVGKDVGLKVLLNTSTDDYFFTKRNTVGFIVQIFNSLFFPDVLTGKLSEFQVSPKTDVLAPISLTSLSSEDGVRMYSVGQRNCYFADERVKEYGTHYSQPECLLKCKIRSIKSLCNCMPFYTPPDFINWKLPVMYCTLSHLECLSRYKIKWSAYRVSSSAVGLEQEREDALNCRNCLPLCNTNEYEYQLDKADFNPAHNDPFLSNETNLKDVSLLRIFYRKPFGLQYKKRPIYSPQSLFANVGGILGISIGCSLISVIEIFYFALYKFFLKLAELRRVHFVEKNKNLEIVRRNRNIMD